MDRVRSVVVVAVALLEQATGIGLAVVLGLFSEMALRGSTGGLLPLALGLVVFVMLTQGTFIAGYFTRLRLQEEIQDEVDRRFVDAVGTTPTLEVHERSSRSDKAAIVRSARGEIGPGFDRLMWLGGAALALIASAVLMASVVPVLAVLPLFAVPTVLATQAADKRRGKAVERAMPRTRLADHLYSLATTAAPGRETRLFGLGANYGAGTARSGTRRAGRSRSRTGGPRSRWCWRGCSSCWRTRRRSSSWCGPVCPVRPRWASS